MSIGRPSLTRCLKQRACMLSSSSFLITCNAGCLCLCGVWGTGQTWCVFSTVSLTGDSHGRLVSSAPPLGAAWLWQCNTPRLRTSWAVGRLSSGSSPGRGAGDAASPLGRATAPVLEDCAVAPPALTLTVTYLGLVSQVASFFSPTVRGICPPFEMQSCPWGALELTGLCQGLLGRIVTFQNVDHLLSCRPHL